MKIAVEGELRPRREVISVAAPRHPAVGIGQHGRRHSVRTNDHLVRVLLPPGSAVLRTAALGRVQAHRHGRLGVERRAERRALAIAQIAQNALGKLRRQRHALLPGIKRIQPRADFIQHGRIRNEILMVLVHHEHVAFVYVVYPVVVLVVQPLEVQLVDIHLVLAAALCGSAKSASGRSP